MASSSPLMADEPRGLGEDAPPVAESRYQSAIRLYRAGQFAGAADEFRVALAMHRVPKLAYNLARSLERAGDPAGAIEHYRLYLELAPDAPDRAAIDQLIPVLDERLRARYPEIALLSSPPGARVYDNGGAEPVLAATPGSVKLPPGLHLLRFEIEGRPPVERSIHLAEGANTPVEVAFPALQAAAPVEPLPPPPPPGRAAWRTPVALGLLALGATGVVTGAIFTAKVSDTASAASEVVSDARYAELESDYQTQETWQIIGFAAGGALLAGGAALLLWPDGGGDGAPAVAPTPGGAVLTGRF